MKSSPLLSIIIPVFNDKPFLENLFLSLEKQGFQEGDLEIICVDDGSSDGSAEWLDAYALTHENVIVLHKTNGGECSARNCGMEVMTGRFFEFVDADDELLPYSIHDIFKAMEQGDFAVAQFDFVRMKTDLNKSLKYKVKPMTLTGSIWRYIFSRTAFGHIRFDEKLKYAGDTFFAQTIALHNPNCLYCDRTCYVYNENSNSVMAKRDFIKAADSMMRLAENHKKYLDEGMFPESKKRIKIWCARATAGYIYYSLRGGRDDYPFDMLRNKGLYPYKNEWQLLKIHFMKKGGLRQTVSNYCLFFLGFKTIWKIVQKSGILRKVSN